MTEPNAGLDTTSITTFARKVDGGYRVSGRKIWTSTAQIASKILLLTRTTAKSEGKRPVDGMTVFYTDLDRTRFEVKSIEKHGRAAVDSNMVFIDDVFIRMRPYRGGGQGLLLHARQPEPGAHPGRRRGHRDRPGRARPCGALCPRAHCLRSADRPEPGHTASAGRALAGARGRLADDDEGRRALRRRQACGAEANGAKFLGARAGYDACLQAVLTHGGMGYAKEYQVERLLREVLVTRIAPVSEPADLVLIAEKVLGQPKSY